jgi:hypothetical protein
MPLMYAAGSAVAALAFNRASAWAARRASRPLGLIPAGRGRPRQGRQDAEPCRETRRLMPSVATASAVRARRAGSCGGGSPPA